MERFGRYVIESELGRGGMAVLYRAHDPELDRTVALKVMATHLSEQPAFRQRFEAEARAASAVDHPNIVPVYDVGLEDGQLYLVMRYVAGQDLRSAIADAGTLDVETTVAIVTQIGAALQAIHQAGLVHRDVKPANVLLTVPAPGGTPHAYLADFGLTKPSAATDGLTETGELIGTVDYMAPERLDDRADQSNPASDQYALGALTYTCLTGTAPFHGRPALGVLNAHLTEPPPALPSDGPTAPLAPVVAKALAKDPAERYPSTLAFADALRKAAAAPLVTAAREAIDALDGDTVRRSAAAAPMPAAGDPEPAPRRRTFVALALVGVLALIGVGLAFALSSSDDTPLVASSTDESTTSTTEELVEDDDEPAPASTVVRVDETPVESTIVLPGTTDDDGQQVEPAPAQQQPPPPQQQQQQQQPPPPTPSTTSSTTSPPASQPGPPSQVRASVSKAEGSACRPFGPVTMSVSWSAPADDGGSAITKYRVFRQYLLISGGAVTERVLAAEVNGGERSAVMSAPHRNENGYWRHEVEAVNGVGASTAVVGNGVVPDVRGVCVPLARDYLRAAGGGTGVQDPDQTPVPDGEHCDVTAQSAAGGTVINPGTVIRLSWYEADEAGWC